MNKRFLTGFSFLHSKFLSSRSIFSLGILLLAPSSNLLADSPRPDDHAPAGVMSEHTHRAGEFMFAHRYMHVNMDGMREDDDRLSNEQVLGDFMVTPTEMDMDMHMLGVMYAPADSITTMLMLPYSEMSMQHLTRSGREFETKSRGIGDISLSALHPILEKTKTKVHASLGLSIPTGNIDKTDDTPARAAAPLPYPMQLGSGTWDLMPGLTYVQQLDRLSLGAQASGLIRTDRNSNHYRLGNRAKASTWVSSVLTDNLSLSLRLAWEKWGNISGANPELNPQMVPTADPNRQAGQQIDVALGVNTVFNIKSYTGRLILEAALPIHRDLDGPQLETDFKISAGLQISP